VCACACVYVCVCVCVCVCAKREIIKHQMSLRAHYHVVVMNACHMCANFMCAYYMCPHVYVHVVWVHMCMRLFHISEPSTYEWVPFHLNLQSQSPWSHLPRSVEKRPWKWKLEIKMKWWLLFYLVVEIQWWVSFHLNLQSHSNRSLFIGTWQKRRRELDDRLRLQIEELTLQTY